jgi:hypothetical protein
LGNSSVGIYSDLLIINLSLPQIETLCLLMKKTFCFFAVTLFLTQYNCTFKKDRIDALWFYTYSTGKSESDAETVTPVSFIDLQADKTYSRDFRGFDYGHWEKKDSLLLLASIKGDTAVFPIKYLFGNELRLLTGKGTTVSFESQPGKFPSAAENPFSAENNQWRIPATKKENEPELKKRLKNHCKFYELYFRWALRYNLNSIDVRSTPSLIKVYGNGFALKEFDELPDVWRAYFYDEEDCRKATDILKDIFEHKDIAWAHSDNKYKMFISAFQQLQEFIK